MEARGRFSGTSRCRTTGTPETSYVYLSSNHYSLQEHFQESFAHELEPY
jgi:hypothetical protein